MSSVLACWDDQARPTLGDSPEVLATLDRASVSSGDLLGTADDGEGHGSLDTGESASGTSEAERAELR